MKVLIAAIQELLEFAWGEFFSTVADRAPDQVASLPELPAPQKIVSVSNVRPVPYQEQGLVRSEVVAQKSLPLHGVVGFVTVPLQRVWVRPVFTFDGDVWHIPYATRVEILGYEGRFAEIRCEGRHGWVLKDEISTIDSELFPTFNTGEIYSANHPETKKLRRLRGDEFAGRELYLPLQNVEYVTYELARHGQRLSFGDARPRLAGNWQNLLKGKAGVVMSIDPHTGSLIEYLREDGVGFVGYVEAVLVDETIVVSGIGRLIAGEFRRETITKAAWMEWRPVFIQVT